MKEESIKRGSKMCTLGNYIGVNKTKLEDKTSPKELQTKIVKRFALFPVSISGGLVWLRFYYTKYRFESGGYYENLKDGFYFGDNDPRNQPRMFGSYRWPDWVEKEKHARPDDICISEIDDFYTCKRAE